MIQNKKQMYLVIGAFALVMLLGGVTYAFFNYTRTGTANTIRVGRIAFNTTQASGQDGAINLSNAFPITRTLAATDNTNAGEVVITITGDTTYSGGVEYLVTATDVTNTVNSKTVPISIIATASNGLGTADDSYFTNRGGNSSIYKVLANETISNNDQLLVGYIAPDNNQTGVNGTITIRAYLDSDLVAISDTYNNGNTPTDNLGTPASFGENKVVLTTTEWNSLRTNGVSFKVKVVAQEDTWVEAPVVIPTIASCPNCKFIFPKYGESDRGIKTISYDSYTYQGHYIGPTVLTSGYSENYNDIVTITGQNFFVGVLINESNLITNIYGCGIYNSVTPFCIEVEDGTSGYVSDHWDENPDYWTERIYPILDEVFEGNCVLQGNGEPLVCEDSEQLHIEVDAYGSIYYRNKDNDDIICNVYNDQSNDTICYLE